MTCRWSKCPLVTSKGRARPYARLSPNAGRRTQSHSTSGLGVRIVTFGPPGTRQPWADVKRASLCARKLDVATLEDDDGVVPLGLVRAKLRSRLYAPDPPPARAPQ